MSNPQIDTQHSATVSPDPNPWKPPTLETVIIALCQHLPVAHLPHETITLPRPLIWCTALHFISLWNQLELSLGHFSTKQVLNKAFHSYMLLPESPFRHPQGIKATRYSTFFCGSELTRRILDDTRNAVKQGRTQQWYQQQLHIYRQKHECRQ